MSDVKTRLPRVSVDPADPAGNSLYERDFYRWSVEQAAAIRNGNWYAVDFENIAEEIESVGRNDRRSVRSHLRILLAHLLKCLVQPERWSESWDHTIRAQRNAIVELLERSPSLRRLPAEVFAEEYDDAIFLAHRDTGLAEGKFPAEPPFTLDEALSPNYFPGPARGKDR